MNNYIFSIVFYPGYIRSKKKKKTGIQNAYVLLKL